MRRYRPDPVEPDKLRLLAEAFRLAPSASNAQPWRLILVDDPAVREQVARATLGPFGSFNTFVPEAPVLAVFVLHRPPLLNQAAQALVARDFTLIDVGLAAAHFCLRATDLGLGTCILGWFDERRIKRLLDVPRGARIGLVITLGYPPADYPARPKHRKPLDDVCRRNVHDGPALP